MQQKPLRKSDIQDWIPGIDFYAPHSSNVKKLNILTSGGTSGSSPILLVERYTFTNEPHTWMYGTHGSLVKLSRNHTNLAHLRGFVYESSPAQRVLYPDAKDLTNPLFHKKMEEFSPTDVYGAVSFVMRWINTLVQNSAHHIFTAIHTVTTVGEHVSKLKEEKMRRLMPHAQLRVTYSFAEIGLGLLAYECQSANRAEGSVYHPFTQNTISFEIMNPDTDGVGELIVTTPFGKYSPGDIGKIEGQCVCSAQTSLILCGRKNYDVVTCNGAVFYRSEVERVFSDLSSLVSDYLVEVKEREEEHKSGGRVILTIVPTETLKEMPSPMKYIADAFERSLFVTKTRTLGQVIQADILQETKVQFSDTIPHERKEVRLKKR